MTAINGDDFLVSGPVCIAADVEATSQHLRIRETAPWGEGWPGTSTLLDDFCALASAEPDEMAVFLRTSGIPERLRLEDTKGVTTVRVDYLRRTARAYQAARNIGAALRQRRGIDNETDWLAIQRVPGSDYDGFRLIDPRDWKDAREVMAEWISKELEAGGAGMRVEWPGRGPIKHRDAVPGMSGLLAFLLLREWERGTEHYLCEVCRRHVTPGRPPRKSELVYCADPACKREQARRRQERHRAARKGKGQS